MKKTLFLVTALLCFGVCTANAERPYENRGEVRAVMTPLETAPQFVYPAELGFGVAVGIPYDLYYISDSQYLAYYLCKDNVWYIGTSYFGPWTVIDYRSLPPMLRKYKIAKIRTFRDRDHLMFHEQKENYKGKHFRPEPIAPHNEMKEEHKGEGKGEGREEKGRMH